MSNKYLCTLYLRILYRCIASKNRFLNRLCRFIARKICLYRQKCRFIAQNLTNCITSSPGKSYYLEICVASSKEFTNLGRFYCFVVAGKFLFGFFYCFICDKNFGQPNCIALFDFFLKNCVSVSL
jgi:hypothetical protein